MIGTQILFKNLTGTHSIATSEQGNAAEMRQVNPLMQTAKMMRPLEKDRPQIYQKPLCRGLVDPRCNE